VERYGGIAGIELAEQVFEADSDAVLGIIELLDPKQDADTRWRVALRGMHQLMVDLGLDSIQRIRLMEQCRARFGVEHHVNVEFEKQLGAKFRTVRASLQELLVTPVGAGHPLDPAFALLKARSERLRPIVRALEISEREGRLSISMAELTASFLHMHANRLLRSEQRAQELVLYDFLLRLYESEAARKRKGQ